MKPFLHETAGYLYEKYGNDLSSCSLVFPNRRAGLYFSGYLSGLIDKPLWLPKMFTISELMQELSKLQPADPLTLNFELFRIFRKVTNSSEDFDEFYNWGEILIGDFDQADKYLVDAGAIFRNVSELKNIESRFDFLSEEQVSLIKSFWKSFSVNKPSELRKKFLYIWESLAEIYAQYKEVLCRREIAYEGMIFRDVAEMVRDRNIQKELFEKYFIVGFNALNECEKVLFDFLKSENRVEFFWDYDEYYITNTRHQAGYFLRKNLERYPHSGFISGNSNLKGCRTRIEIVAVPSNSGQAKILPGLREMFSKEDPLQTAVILPDEGLLLPVLSSLPADIADINVTMGYPLKDSSLFGLLMQVVSLQKNSRQGATGKLMFHHRDVISILQHPDYQEKKAGAAEEKVKKILANNITYAGKDLLNDSDIERLVFREAKSGLDIIDYITGLTMHIVKNRYSVSEGDRDESNQCDPFKEFAFRVYTGVGRLKEILVESGIEPGFSTLVRLLRKVLHGIKVPFHGEPLTGVQVMGVLETRGLDFENIIVLSVNEGVFPARHQGSSFIPWSLRKAFGLPGQEQQDAVYAYYFYRLLHRCKNMTLVYNTRSDGLFTGEMSRFIYQLKFDRNFNISEKGLVFDLLPVYEKPVNIEKTPEIAELLRQFTGEMPGRRFLSPNAINTYIDCTLRFYFRYIAKFPEPDEIKDEVDMAVFGNLLHKSAQLIYTPFTGRVVTAGDIGKIAGNQELIENYVKNAFNEIFFTDVNDKPVDPGGINQIISEVLVIYLKQLLERDRKLAPFVVKGLEKKFYGKIRVIEDGEDIFVNLGGIIDRVDEAGGLVRVVDYKTGNDDPAFKNLDSLFERGNSKRPRSVFQTFMYAWLYMQDSPGETAVSPLLYQFRKFFGDDPDVIFEKPSRGIKKAVFDFNDYRNDFESALNATIAELFDPNTGFGPADDRDICRYCPYNRLCHRS